MMPDLSPITYKNKPLNFKLNLDFDEIFSNQYNKFKNTK